MSFKFIGKTKLLRTLKMQMNNPNIWFKDVMYSREENFNHHRKEMIVFIDKSGTQYQVRHEYNKHDKKTTLYYEIATEITPCNYKIELKNLLKESENS
jgi:hypothetical protein